MKVLIKSSEIHMCLRLPLGLIFNKVTLAIAIKAISTTNIQIDIDIVNIPAGDLQKLFRIMRCIRRNFRGLTLLDIKGAEGTIVEITI